MVQVVEDGTVFVVHGRNTEARDAMFQFLRALGLKPLEWSDAISLTRSGSPFIGDVLDKSFQNVAAVVVIMTGDDEARLRRQFRSDDEGDSLSPQPRPNVMFEAGMAFGLFPNKTVLVEIGSVKSFSDLAGRHAVRFASDSPASRNELVARLKNCNCPVNTNGNDWLNVGDFTSAIGRSRPPVLETQSSPAVVDISERSNLDVSKGSRHGSNGVDRQEIWTGLHASLVRAEQHSLLSDDEAIYVVIGNYGPSTLLNVKVAMEDAPNMSEQKPASNDRGFFVDIGLMKPDGERRFKWGDAKDIYLSWFLRSIQDQYNINLTCILSTDGRQVSQSQHVSLASVFAGERAGPWMYGDGRIVEPDHPLILDSRDPHPDNLGGK